MLIPVLKISLIVPMHDLKISLGVLMLMYMFMYQRFCLSMIISLVTMQLSVLFLVAMYYILESVPIPNQKSLVLNKFGFMY